MTTEIPSYILTRMELRNTPLSNRARRRELKQHLTGTRRGRRWYYVRQEGSLNIYGRTILVIERDGRYVHYALTDTEWISLDKRTLRSVVARIWWNLRREFRKGSPEVTEAKP